MLRQYELVEKVLDYDPDADEAMLNRAYVYTVQKHGSQKRASGDPYFSHPVEVAGLMTDLKLDQATNEAVRGLRWGEEARLRAIDADAFWEGRVNRAGLMRRFGISVPQATIDLRAYQLLAPENLRYDTREKAYLATEGFKPLFGPPEAEAWLVEEAGVASVPGSVFGDDRHLRFSYACDLTTLEEGMQRLGQALGRLTA